MTSKAAAEYAVVPRAEHLRHQLTRADTEAFGQDPRFRMIAGISMNGEADTPAHRLSIVLDLMDVAHAKDQLVGIARHLFRSQAKSDVQVALISLDMGRTADSVQGTPLNQ